MFFAFAAALLSPSLPARAGDAGGFPLSEKTMKSLTSAKVNDRAAAIAELSANAAEETMDILRALRDGRLYHDRANNAIILVETDGAARDVASGARLDTGREGLKRIAVNNGQREEITKTLNAFALS